MPLTFLTDADHDSARPRKMMKKNGPQRSQSRKAFPGTSRFGFGNTTSFKLPRILDRSLLTVSHTGSVQVFEDDPKPEFAISCREFEEGRLVGTGIIGIAAMVGFLEVGGIDDDMNGLGEVETGIEALGGLAGRTVEFPASFAD